MDAIETLGGENVGFAEELYAQYLADPDSVDAAWQAFFAPLRGEPLRGPLRPSPSGPRSIFNPEGVRRSGDGVARAATAAPPSGSAQRAAELQDRLDQLSEAFRATGHLEALLDPLDRPRPARAELNPRFHGIADGDLDLPCSSVSLGAGGMTVGQVIRRLRNTYCRYIGVEFMHLLDAEARSWLQERMESTENRCVLSVEEQVMLLSKLIDAEVFEQFIRKKYLGAKSFSLEGGESLIPLLDRALEQAGAQGVQEVVIGMAHRGRLNVLTNILGKYPREIFREFDDSDAEQAPELYWGRGDVKYHMGFRSRVTTRAGHTLCMRLAFNPSHLEFVGPVVLGRVRARQDRRADLDRTRGLAIVLHGDAAFAGQGIVQEMLNLSGLPGYRVGGTLHVIVNNQIGFTTPPASSRTTGYASDAAKMLQAPIFHVNGEHPESVAQVVQLALEFRARFRCDVVIDMYCYRRHGHNEGDEPSFTQPLMYEQIRRRPTVREGYLEHLLAPGGGGLSAAQAEQIIAQRTAFLEAELQRAREEIPRRKRRDPAEASWPWTGMLGGPEATAPAVETRVEEARLAELLTKTVAVPEGFNVFPKLRRILDARLEMAAGQRPLDWGAGEALAFATLLVDGVPVRLSGQDVGRGTFSHRHCVIHDCQVERQHVPLQHLASGQARFEVWDSPLSEAGVLAFDYGYSLDRPDALVLWEAQFGDFVNGAQVIIDQFISSAEDKWDLLSGLVMLLPHGFEGQGPEHSSARLERFLQLCAEDNMVVVNLTTPAQLFHCLRRQALRPWRKPLVVMSPKSLLRHPSVVSPLADLVRGSFQKVIADGSADAPVRRVLLTSGRLYYDLAEYRGQRERRDVEVVRLEQLYPFPEEELRAALEPLLTGGRGGPGFEVVWVQEEPLNMGAWYYLRARFGESMWGKAPLRCVARDESASPATGSPSSHKREQEILIARAFWS